MKMNKHLDSNFCLLSPLDLANAFNFYILKGDYSPSEQLAHRLYQSEAASLGSCTIIYEYLSHIQCLPFSPKKQIGDCSLGSSGRFAFHKEEKHHVFQNRLSLYVTISVIKITRK